MLGHFKPHACSLSVVARSAYKRAYCTLCLALRNEFGLTSSLLVNHEITIMLVAFAPQKAAIAAYTHCPAQLWLKRRPIYANHPIANESAGFALLLAWLKVIDWETDRPSKITTGLRRVLERKLKNWHHDQQTSKLISNYAALTRRHNAGLHEVSNQSAELTSHMIQLLGQKAATGDAAKYAEVFALAAGIVPLADHLLDVAEDTKAGAFNPIIEQAARSGRSIATTYQDFYQQYQSLARQLEGKLTHFRAIAPIFAEIALNSTSYLSERIINNTAANQEKKKDAYSNCSCDPCPNYANNCDTGGCENIDCSNSGDCCNGGGDCCSGGGDCCGGGGGCDCPG